MIRLDRPGALALRVFLPVGVLLLPFAVAITFHLYLPQWFRMVHLAVFMTTFFMVMWPVRQAVFLTAVIVAARGVDSGYRRWVHDGWESWIVLMCVAILAGYVGRRLFQPHCRI